MSKKINTIIKIDSSDKFFCYHCQTDFHEGDTLVIVSTHKIEDIERDKKKTFLSGELIEKVTYHGDCWRNWFMGRMETIAENKYGKKPFFRKLMDDFHARLRQ
jgi:hypothetical protein